ncbi:LOW QUALITY PROTEIN: hypothetical protein YC2023_096516 [Brassica napus]
MVPIFPTVGRSTPFDAANTESCITFNLRFAAFPVTVMKKNPRYGGMQAAVLVSSVKDNEGGLVYLDELSPKSISLKLSSIHGQDMEPHIFDLGLMHLSSIANNRIDHNRRPSNKSASSS